MTLGADLPHYYYPEYQRIFLTCSGIVEYFASDAKAVTMSREATRKNLWAGAL